MNIYDSELVASILTSEGYKITNDINQAKIVLINTCSVREHAEDKVLNRIKYLEKLKFKDGKQFLLGIIGCMSQRLKDDLINFSKAIDFIVGPDNYRNLIKIINELLITNNKIYCQENNSETYEDIVPKHFLSNGVSTYISITRGCENFCSYCVVPYVRGKERSKKPENIIKEITNATLQGFKEIVLIGQNVDSYYYEGINFPMLLKKIAINFPNLRIRFTTNHPKDLTDELIEVISMYPNIARHIHLPVQSGSNKILKLMNRNYTREYYLNRIKRIKEIIPDCTISTDILVGFCYESENDFLETLSLMEEVIFDQAFMFKYSPRKGTYAYENYEDTVPEEIKIQRLQKVISLQLQHGLLSKQKAIGKTYTVLIENYGKKKNQYLGRNSQNQVIIFESSDSIQLGTYVNVLIEKATPATLIGKLIEIIKI